MLRTVSILPEDCGVVVSDSEYGNVTRNKEYA